MVRITGGEFRGRSLRTPPGVRTRPTQAKLRQALFNSLQMYIPEARCLDLFAGSGALGFEALSRGAAQVTFVESARAAAKLIEENAREFACLDRTEIVSSSVENFKGSAASHGPFDIAMADPPYAAGWELKILEYPWLEVLSPQGFLVLEWGTQKSKVEELPLETPFLVKVREKIYGDSVLTTYQRKP